MEERLLNRILAEHSLCINTVANLARSKEHTGRGKRAWIRILQKVHQKMKLTDLLVQKKLKPMQSFLIAHISSGLSEDPWDLESYALQVHLRMPGIQWLGRR